MIFAAAFNRKGGEGSKGSSCSLGLDLVWRSWWAGIHLILSGLESRLKVSNRLNS